MKKSMLLVLMSAVSLTSFSLCGEPTKEKEELSPRPVRRHISPVAFDEVVHALQMGPQATVTIDDDEYVVLDGLPRLKSSICDSDLGFDLFKRAQIRFLPSAGSGVKWIYAGLEHVNETAGDYLTLHFTQGGANSSEHPWHQEYNGYAVAPIGTVNFLLKKRED